MCNSLQPRFVLVSDDMTNIFASTPEARKVREAQVAA